MRRHFIRGSIYLRGDKIQIGSAASARGPASICHGDATRRYRLARPRNYPRRARILQRTSVIYRAERSASCLVAARSLFSVFSSSLCLFSPPLSHPPPSFVYFHRPTFPPDNRVNFHFPRGQRQLRCLFFFRVLPHIVSLTLVSVLCIYVYL